MQSIEANARFRINILYILAIVIVAVSAGGTEAQRVYRVCPRSCSCKRWGQGCLLDSPCRCFSGLPVASVQNHGHSQ